MERIGEKWRVSGEIEGGKGREEGKKTNLDKEKTDDFSGTGDDSATLEGQDVASLIFLPVADNSLLMKVIISVKELF